METAESPPAGRGARGGVVALLGYTAMAAALFAGAWRDPVHNAVGLEGDPQQTMWFLRWTPFALAHHLDPFTTGFGNAPDGVNLMWNTSMPLAGLLLAPVTTTLGPVVAYDLLITASLALSAWCAFLVARRWTRGIAGPAVCGGLYGFSPYMAAQATGHANLTVGITPPLLLMLLDDLLVRRRSTWRCGTLIGLLAAAQLLISEEVLAGEVLVAACGVGVMAVLHRDEVRARVRDGLSALGIGAVVFLPLVTWPLAVQFLGPQRTSGPTQARDTFVSDLLGFVVPTTNILVAPERLLALSADFTGNASEVGNYVGPFAALLVVAAVVTGRREPAVRFFATTGVVVAILSLGPHMHYRGHVSGIPLPWLVIDHTPVLSALLPGRLMLYVYLAAGVVIATLVDRTGRRAASPSRRIATWAVVGAAALTLIPRQPFPSASLAVPAFFTDGGLDPLPEGSTVLFGPYPGLFTLGPMLWTAEAGIHVRMRGGYFYRPDQNGATTSAYDTSATATAMIGIKTGVAHPLPSGGLRDSIRAEWRQWGITAVVVGDTPARDETVAFITGILGEPPQSRDGVQIWSDVPATLGAS